MVVRSCARTPARAKHTLIQAWHAVEFSAESTIPQLTHAETNAMKVKTSKLWLRNTSRYPDYEVWPLAKAAYESIERSLHRHQTMPRIAVKFTNYSHTFRGRAYWSERDEQGRDWKRILARVGAPDKFPVRRRDPRFKSDMPEYDCRTYREAIVMVIAHEIEHCLGTPGGKDGEFRCAMAGWDAIDYFRKYKSEIEAEMAAGKARQAKARQSRAARLAQARRPEVRLAKKLKELQAALSRWQRKSKLAATKVKKYSQAITRCRKKVQSQAL